MFVFSKVLRTDYMSDQYLHFAEDHKSRASKLPYLSALASLADSRTYF